MKLIFSLILILFNKQIKSEDLFHHDYFKNDFKLDLLSRCLFDNKQSNYALPTKGLRLDLNVYLDKKFQNAFGAKREKIVSGILSLTNDIFHWESLGTTIELNTIQIKDIPDSLSVTKENWFDMGEKYSKNDKLGANIFFTVSSRDQDLVAKGISKHGSICSSPEMRTIIIAWEDSNNATAVSLAHEFGHMLGMFHDFETSSPKTQRYDKQGNLCTDIGGIMDYDQTNYLIWSSCSLQDLKQFFFEELQTNNGGFMFCIKSMIKTAISEAVSGNSEGIGVGGVFGIILAVIFVLSFLYYLVNECTKDNKHEPVVQWADEPEAGDDENELPPFTPVGLQVNQAAENQQDTKL